MGRRRKRRPWTPPGTGDPHHAGHGGTWGILGILVKMGHPWDWAGIKAAAEPNNWPNTPWRYRPCQRWRRVRDEH